MNMGKNIKIFSEDPISMDEITENLNHQEEKKLVSKALEKSLESIGSLPSDNSKALVLREITDMFLDSGFLYLGKRLGEKTLDSASDIKIKPEKAKTLSGIASTFAEYDFDEVADKIFKKALKEAEKIEEEREKVEVFIYIIEEQLDKDLKGRAQENIDKVLSKALNLAERDRGIIPLAMVAETMAKLDKKRVEELCQRVLEYIRDEKPEDDWRIVVTLVAKAFSKIGRYKRSMELAEELTSENGSDIHLLEIGTSFSNEGQIERALEIRDHMNNRELKDPLTGQIAEDLILDGLLEKALRLKEDLKDEFERDLLLKNLVCHYGTDDRERARKYLNQIRSEEMKALAYIELANSYLKEKNNYHKAKEFSLKAKEMIVDSESESVKVELIETLVDVELKDQAYELADQIATSEERAIAFGSIAAHTC